MLRRCVTGLVKGKPPRSPMYAPHWFIPDAHKPHQGGQQHFQQHLLARADAAAVVDAHHGRTGGAAGASGAGARGLGGAAAALRSLLPQAEAGRLPAQLMDAPPLPDDAVDPSQPRAFHDTSLVPSDDPHAGSGAASPTATRAVGDDFFRNHYGYSLLKEPKKDAQLPPDAAYAEVDLWAELPKYSRSTYFLYLINRRRNAYAVVYSHDGHRMHPTYSAGNRGLTKGDKGFRAEGSAENAHQVTSQYLADVIPKIREREAAAGRIKAGETKKIDVVVRVMGFYNGRQGALRAVQDKSEDLNVRLLEDITPYPLNGPRMPRATKRG